MILGLEPLEAGTGERGTAWVRSVSTLTSIPAALKAGCEFVGEVHVKRSSSLAEH